MKQYDWLDTVRANVQAFPSATAGKAPYPFTDAEKVGNIAVLEAVARSAAMRQPVKI
mgnify:FL=1